MAVTKKGPTLDDDEHLPTRFFGPSMTRGIAGGLAGLDADGDVIDKNGTKVTGGGGVPDLHDAALTGNATTETPAVEAAGTQIVNAEWVRELRLTIANARENEIIDVPCYGDVQLPRAEYTDRLDVRLNYEKATDPSYADGFAIVRDLWTRRSWPAQ